ncbi:hypothetical protein PBY51_018134 [Eleginops maclovinus]|uniref:Uncharacterized protein n=1 Tax=Eleginops maclovinus TaxID=56733 RepID=A0AAN7XLL1_ELEMC|nr:hypothetical protein PBY51_018134 [Eleginops maclovinus]
MERVRDKVQRGKRREGICDGAEEQNGRKSMKNRRCAEGGGGVRGGMQGGEKCSSSPLRSHYLQRHAAKALSLHSYKDICRRDRGISPASKSLPNSQKLFPKLTSGKHKQKQTDMYCVKHVSMSQPWKTKR